MGVLVVLLVAAAGFLTWKAFSLPGPESIEAPLPAQEFTIPAGAVVGPTGMDPVEVNTAGGGDADGGGADNDGGGSGGGGGASATGTMTVAKMAPNTLFIPALGVYMPVEADSSFEASKYAGFETIKIPDDASRGVWYAGGAPMHGGDQGVTMIAAHVSTSSGWGTLKDLHRLTGGEMIYTTDAQGRRQSWQLTQMRVENHRDFPQEYWSAQGPRSLVVTTCGGRVNAQEYFQQNIFAVAVPVDQPAEKEPAVQTGSTENA